ncbi:MAG: hypothetical protein JSS76_15565 [Bacteroidetes bacterium]|nr:hypothetical protein [Bacteroidota bacterium]
MKRFIYTAAALAFILSASSCKKKVHCQAVDDRGVVINETTTEAEGSLNRKRFEDRYKENFKDYTATCTTQD